MTGETTSSSDDGTGSTGSTLAGLAEVARLTTERDGLRERLEVAARHLDEADRRYDDAVGALADEQRDVARLESFSTTRILAGLRGTRDADLSREQAEVQAAEYAAAEAAARREAAQAEVDHLVRRIAALDGPDGLDARRAALLDRREREVAADPAAATTHARLAELAARQGALDAEVVQLGEALEAAAAARQALAEAARHLGDAQQWATYDTFLGGGVLADLAKHDRLDRAGALMRRADAALRHLATELADVRVEAVGEVGVDGLVHTFDIWFDNLFSDWAVRERIREAAARVSRVSVAVNEVDRDLSARLAGARAELAELATTRATLLSR